MVNENSKYFKQAFVSKVHRDIIFERLLIRRIQDKILNRELQEDECDYREVCNFLLLLV